MSICLQSSSRLNEKPLRVMVTRPQPQAVEMKSRLESLGARVYLFPTIEIRPLQETREIDGILRTGEAYDWVILTSARAVAQLQQRAAELQIELSQRFAQSQWATVGHKTASALAALGFKVDLLPSEAVAEALAEALIQTDVTGKRCLYLRANLARDVLKTRLEAAGAHCDAPPLYETVLPAQMETESALRWLRAGDIDILTFTSASCVHNFVCSLEQAVAPATLADLLEGVQIACIGPVTAAAARECLGRVDLEAREHSLEGLLAILPWQEEVS